MVWLNYCKLNVFVNEEIVRVYEDACDFNMWVRPDRKETFDLKFFVNEGRGVFRISRPGILVDPPAKNDGVVTGLTLADLHATRFLLLPRRGNRRNYLFSDLNLRLLDAMEVGNWNPLEPEIIDGQRSFLPPSFEDDETSIITTAIPIEAMRPSFRPGTNEEARLREDVRKLTMDLHSERAKVQNLEKMVAQLDLQLQQVRQLLGDDELC